MNNPPNQPPTKLSSCHQAPVTIGGTGDFKDSDRAVTQYYVCSECGQPCDLYTPPSTDLKDFMLRRYRYANGLSPHKLKEPLDPLVEGSIDDDVAHLTEVIIQERNKAVTETRLSEASWWYKNHANPNYKEVMNRRFNRWHNEYKALEKEKG